MTQALIVRDRFDNEEITNDLKQYINNNGIKHIVEIPSFNEIELAKMGLNQKEPCILFPNIFIRYDLSLKTIIDFHKDVNFDALILKDTTRIISFIPEKIIKKFKSSSSFSLINVSNFPTFRIHNASTKYVIPKEKPVIFLYTHNRDTYLQLTLNSLDFSLVEKIPIKILLNKPTEKVRQVALDFANSRGYVEVLEANENTFFSSINILIQIFKPEKFIIMEDDFIYPSTTSEYFPNWPFQFLDRLNHFDVVAWAASIDNVSSPYFNSPRCPENNLQAINDWELITPESKTMMLAQSLAVKTDFYISRAKEMKHNAYACSYDTTLISAKKCTPALRGYHIGWNQQMDGFVSLNQKQWPPPVEVCDIKSLTTGEVRTIRPKDLLQ